MPGSPSRTKCWPAVGPLLFTLAVGCSTTDGVTTADATASIDATTPVDRGKTETAVDAGDASVDGTFGDALDASRSGRCTASAECAGTPERPACDTATGLCVGCLASPADTCPAGSYCDATRHCASGCRADADCAARGANLRCDAVLHACVGCLRDADCRLGSLCSEGVCVDGCSVSHGCAVGATCCVSTCAALGSDPLNCGACGHACPTGQLCCEGRCANSSSDALNCGACGHACDLARATPLCIASSCSSSACASGFGDCNLEASDGCEVALGTNVDDCGACGRRCSAGPDATAQCVDGDCGLRCAAGHGNCDGNLGNGCETDLSTTATACGSCTTVCAVPNAIPACVSGRCAVGSCIPGYSDCDGLVANGCETPITTSTNCGACGTVCSLGTVCSGGHCNSTCAAGTTLCTGACADVSSDPSNCGACGRVCAAPPSARATCVAGACAYACNPGYGDCDATPANGCETSLGSAPDHCGACATSCPPPANASASCGSGVCGLGACRTGFADCDGDPANGCEADLASSVRACGACGTVCSAPANASPACRNGTCSVGACNAGFADCDGSAANGCEVALGSSVDHCGTCTSACPAVPNAVRACAGGACGFTCSPGYGDCDGDAANGCETPLLASAAHCGACRQACAARAHSAAACSAGACGLGACQTGFANCDGDPANGCEVTLATDNAHCGACSAACAAGTTCSAGACMAVCAPPTSFCSGACHALQSEAGHCGTCGNACPAAANATPSCTAGLCGISCNAGYGDCDGSNGNGCETPTTTSVMNCGRCGAVCPVGANATPTCSGGTCGFTCASGYHDCGGTCVRNTDPANCGGSCSACSAVANASATCNGTSCDFACSAGYLRSGNACAPDGSCPSAPAYPTAGLVGAYELELDARDASPAHRDGVVVAPVTFGAGSYCQAATFTGTGSIDLPDQRLPTVTVSMRVRYNGSATATTYQPIVDAWSVEENYLLGIDYSMGALRFTAGFHARYDSANVQHEIHIYAPTPVPVGEWHHVAMSFDGTMLRLYVDGTEQARTATPGDSYQAPMTGPPDVRVGRALRGPNYGGAASVDHLLIYNRALSATEIAAL